MNQLSDKSAKQYYSILLDIHQWDIDLAIKVPIFKNLLEIGILNEITGKNHFEDKYDNNKVIEKGQRTYLQDNKEILDRFGDRIRGEVRKDLFTGINDLFAKRNTAEHVKKINFAAYIGTLNTITESIRDFSKIPIPDKLISILDGEIKPPELSKQKSIGKRNKNNNNGLKKSELFKIFKEKLSANINYSNTVYSNINIPTEVWWFELANNKIIDGFNLVLIDQYKRIMYHFLINANSIKKPENIFYQRNDKRKQKTSSIQIRSSDTNNFSDIKNNEHRFQFGRYLVKTIKY